MTVSDDPCPLDCGRRFHGLPKEGTANRPDCPGPWDATPKVPEPTYGSCTGCGSIEVRLLEPSGTRDLSSIGESDKYPIGYGCELCA